MSLDSDLLMSVLRALTPILLAALGGALCERAGVFNIGLEGLMLVGCFTAVSTSWFTGSPWLGVLAAAVASAAYSLILAVGAVTLRGDAVVLGVAMNLLAAGLTSYLLRTVFGVQGTFDDPSLAGLPVVGGFSPLTYLAWAAVVVTAVLLSRHVWGLRLRGVGEAPDAAATLGVSPARYMYAAVLVSGALCGLAGAQLALGNVTLFSENMTAGRGWIAVVAVMLGRAMPLGVLLAALLFGIAEAVGFRLQGLGLPQQATDAAPYVVTLGALFLTTARRRGRTPRTARSRRSPRSTGPSGVAS
ncbi:ABC transporter permease [Streptomyces sp. GbtcB6]|uniref:ABC transporter permease n=1 Tax=Streptomyces sp. GbtcB6 TaxID=2824751 RepID=UPI001C302A0D|nr:ABC transporter permease [Streptomyces sp. GbtcB6]